MIEPFIYNSQPARVIFGSATIEQLPAEADRLGLSRILVLATPFQEEQARRVGEKLGRRAAGIYAGAAMHTPVAVTEDAMRTVAGLKADGLLAVGGGSTTGLAKAIALRTDLPQIIVPTTYAGSEMTPILGETRDGVKTTQSSARVLPEVVIYDVTLTMTLPASTSGVSGMNAIAHAVEALYAKQRNPVISLMARESIRTLALALPRIVAAADNCEARTGALYGAWLSGICLGSVGMALHHKLCHTLGGTFNLPHAETHAIVLPHALAYNAPAIPDVMDTLRGALEATDPALALFDLCGRIGAKRALSEIGMPESGIDIAVERALSNPYWNPRPLERDALRGLIARAFAGQPPQS